MSGRPKVLYAIQGTGNGHVSRARALFPALIEHFDVDLALVGPNSEVELPVKPVWTGCGVTMHYSDRGGIDILRTLKANSVRRIAREIREIPVKHYDFILNDFEFISLRAANKRGVPILGVSHQSAVWNRSSPQTNKFMPVGKWILNHYARCEDNIGFHFESYDDSIFSPVIRQEILGAKWIKGNRIIVYLPAYRSDVLSKVLKSTSFEFTVFHKEALSSLRDDNIQWEPIDAQKFSKELTHCKGVVCSAGFELPSECIHLGIPFTVLPIFGQYEQWCNAESLGKMGVPVLKRLSGTLLESQLNELFKSPPLRCEVPDIRADVVKAILSWWKRMRN